ncbi:MAG TPA: hypothetical protein VMB25_02685 [Bryobacteraceae bacterium]|nr:hypothetical protein [Bryobacteraceae bacterium]
MDDIRQTVERFLAVCREPVLCEPGEESLPISNGNFVLESRNGTVSLQAWDNNRNLVRRVTGIERQTRGKLVLQVERFAKRTGTLELVDLQRAAGENVTRRSSRLHFRDRFRRFLQRQFPTHKLAELTTEADLEHSLSPAYPRALLRQGASAWVAIGLAPDATHPDGVLTFGLIWLDYLRRREPSLAIHGLILYLPASQEKSTCLRLLFLDPAVAQFSVFVYGEDGLEALIDLRDHGNLDTRLDRPSPAARIHKHSLYSEYPEARLESQVRAHIQEIDAGLAPSPVYGQVPAFAAAHRGILDLLAIDFAGRLAVIELKASQDVHLPLQALDYWMRVQWHLNRGEFSARGYFPGRQLVNEPPRLLLVSPALDLHPTNERLLRFFSPHIPVEQLGVGLEWRKELKVMFRSCSPCPSKSSKTFETPSAT